MKHRERSVKEKISYIKKMPLFGFCGRYCLALIASMDWFCMKSNGWSLKFNCVCYKLSEDSLLAVILVINSHDGKKKRKYKINNLKNKIKIITITITIFVKISSCNL